MTLDISEHRRPRPANALVLVLVSAVSLAAVTADREVLPVPPRGFHVASWSDWADAHHPIDVAAGVVRVAVAAALAYLLLVALANLVASITPGERCSLAARRCTPRLLGAALAGSMLAATPAGATPDPAPSDGPGAGATMELIDPSDRVRRTALPWAGPPSVDDTWASQRASRTVVSEMVVGSSDGPSEAVAPEPVPAVRSGEHVVVAGEHLWGIAEQHLRSRGVQDGASVGQYWHALIDANRDRLIDPEDPDLIHPGQVLLLPPQP